MGNNKVTTIDEALDIVEEFVCDFKYPPNQEGKAIYIGNDELIEIKFLYDKARKENNRMEQGTS